MEVTRTCPNCHTDFNPKVDWQECCTSRCANVVRVRRYRAKHRKKGGGPGGNGGGNGGGSSPSLFDAITPVSSDAFVPLPVIGPSESEQRRKPAHRANARARAHGRKPSTRAPLKARKSPKAAA